MRGGHYIAYVRGGEKRKGKAETEQVSSPWYYVSDHYVRQVSLKEVLSCEAYILFYEKNWHEGFVPYLFCFLVTPGGKVSISPPEERDRTPWKAEVSVQQQLPYIDTHF